MGTGGAATNPNGFNEPSTGRPFVATGVAIPERLARTSVHELGPVGMILSPLLHQDEHGPPGVVEPRGPQTGHIGDPRREEGDAPRFELGSSCDDVVTDQAHM